MYAPGVLWTAAKHKIPLLSVMHNNRGYHQEVMHVQRLSNFRNRVANLGGDMGPVGTSIQNPDVEYHKLAESMGWWAKGPIKDPAQLGPALRGPSRWCSRASRPAQRLDATAMNVTAKNLLFAAALLSPPLWPPGPPRRARPPT